MKQSLLLILALYFFLNHSVIANQLSETEQSDSALAAEQEYLRWAEEFIQSLDYQRGKITLPNGIATLNVPENFYYLSAEDSEKVLVDAWGNPPGGMTLGMLFPSKFSPLDPNAWGVTIEYEQEGYVSDKDALEINYDDLLKQMQDETKDISIEREKAGYGTLDLIGWAAKPHYVESSHKLYWAKELQFDQDPVHTLNYNIRALGRQGVLVLNFIASINQLPEIEANLDTVMNIADFDEGHRYEDFNPEIDQVAAYGIGALIAGKAAAKTGFIAAAILFLKKFGVFILAGIAAIAAKMFKKKS